MKYWRPVSLFAAGSFLGLAIGGTGVVMAAGGTITACINQQGAFKLLTAGTCAQNETTLTWNQTGVQGPPGPPGAPGQPGQSGPPGPAGVSNYQVVQVRTTIPAEILDSGFLNATCPSGTKVLGGGYFVGSQGPSISAVIVIGSSPTAANDGWTFRFFNNTGFPVDAVTYANCATVS